MYRKEKATQRIMYSKKENLKTMEWNPWKWLPKHKTKQKKSLQTMLIVGPLFVPDPEKSDYYTPSKS